MKINGTITMDYLKKGVPMNSEEMRDKAMDLFKKRLH